MMADLSQNGLMLSALLDGITLVDLKDDREIHGVSLDSRRVNPGDCFIALSGGSRHGAEFAHAAVVAGARAILIDDIHNDMDVFALNQAIPMVRIANLRQQVGLIASRFFGNPSSSLDVVAVTGTNGKTTVAQLCAHALNRVRGKAGYVGTLGLGLIDELEPSINTTPDPVTLQKLFRHLHDDGCQSVAIEVSSHAIVQSRVLGTAIDVAVFTNLGHDHLDYHASRDDYAVVKKSLFQYDGIRHAVINVDDEVGRDLVAELDRDICCWTYSMSRAHVDGCVPQRLDLVRYIGRIEYSTLIVATPMGQVEIQTPLLGDFNAQNLMAALGVLMALGIDAKAGADALSHAPATLGRMQIIESNSADDPVVVVDYAHTPESLARVLAALKSITTRNLVCVFGCGGERDTTKRALMGLVAEQGADRVIITSDNPRGENNADIAAAILLGMRAPQRAEVVHDRACAIKSAIDMSGALDVVLIAGKGHEARQEAAGKAQPFSDADVAYQALRGSGR
jgi:UDP-N-acetylmuramoyl-L-alanyl-D-glutamate--2,6-diaminopimelate ligase